MLLSPQSRTLQTLLTVVLPAANRPWIMDKHGIVDSVACEYIACRLQIVGTGHERSSLENKIVREGVKRNFQLHPAKNWL